MFLLRLALSLFVYVTTVLIVLLVTAVLMPLPSRARIRTLSLSLIRLLTALLIDRLGVKDTFDNVTRIVDLTEQIRLPYQIELGRTERQS